jgi:anti-sigma B factor antagonist
VTTLTVRSDVHEGWALLRVAGEIDLVSGGQIRSEVHRLVAEGRRRIVLDLSGVSLCDSSGVGVLIGARRLLRSCSGELRLILPPSGEEESTHVHQVFAALGIRRLFDIHADLASATATESGAASATPERNRVLPS